MKTKAFLSEDHEVWFIGDVQGANDIICTVQETVEGSQTQSPDCKAVRRRSMHSLPADTEKK